MYSSEYGDSLLVNKTLLLFKPDATMRPAIMKALVDELRTLGLSIEAAGIDSSPQQTRMAEHYFHLRSCAIFPYLMDYLTHCGPIIAVLIGCERGSAVEKLRDIAGNCNEPSSMTHTLRAHYSSSKTVNCFHSSDSSVAAAREIRLWEDILRQNSSASSARAFIDSYVKKKPSEHSLLFNCGTIRRLCFRNGVKDCFRSKPKVLHHQLLLIEQIVPLLEKDCRKDVTNDTIETLAEIIINTNRWEARHFPLIVFAVVVILIALCGILIM